MSAATAERYVARDPRTGDPIEACTLEEPEVMFPQEREGDFQIQDQFSDAMQLARSVCRGCFFREECGERAIAEERPNGVWGALSTLDRQHIAEARRKDDQRMKRQHYRLEAATQHDVPLAVGL